MDNNLFTLGFTTLIFFILSVGFFWAGWKAMKKNKLAATWPTTQGTIINSTLESYRKSDDEGHIRTYYRPMVTYQYQVENDQFVCSQVKVSGFSSSTMRRQQEKKLAAYPEGGQVTVYYDPSDPSEALLEIKKGMINLPMVLGIGLLGAFLYFAYRMVMAF